jgi:hypothetical protein
MLLDCWGDGGSHVHVVLASRLRGILLIDRVRTKVVKVLLWDSVIVHIKHVKLLFLRDYIILLILLCPFVGAPVIGFLCLGRMCHGWELIGTASIQFSRLGNSCVTFELR